jgi:hypothetical protein
MKQIILSLILALATQFSFAVAPDSLKRDLEDYDYLVSFVEENYAPFDAIMQKGYKREYKALKKQIRKQLCEGDKDLEQAATDYVLWFYSQFDRHIMLESETFHMAEANLAQAAIFKSDSTMLTNPGSFEYAPMPVSCKVDSLTWLIRIPSCEQDFHEGAIKALQQFLASDCENLIIDIRGNGGGSDAVWEQYYDLLYDHTYKREIKWFRNTPKNLLFWKNLLEQQPSSANANYLIEKSEASRDNFVKQGESDDGSTRQTSTRIKRAAVLIDFMTASAAESLAEFVKKHSHRAKVYGIGNTFGCELTGNCRTEPLPNSKLGLFYATTVDSGFYEKDFTSEGLGIAPDILITLPIARKLTYNIDEWVQWVAEDLKN